MKKFYFLLIALCFFATTKAQIVNIPDTYFKEKLLLASPDNTIAKNLAGNYFKIDANSDYQIQVSEALQVSYLDIPPTIYITSLTGIENFTNLINLNCPNNRLITLDLHNLIKLKKIDCSTNRLTSLNLTGLSDLQYLDCNFNSLNNIDLSNFPNLQYLDCGVNNLSSIDVNNLLNLQQFYCNFSNLTSLNVNNLTKLTSLACGFNKLINLNLSGLTNLNYLSCSENKLSTIDLSSLKNLIDLNCATNQINYLDLNNLSNLERFDCSQNMLTTLNVNNLSNLTNLTCYQNLLTTIDLNGLSNLLVIDLRFNKLGSIFIKNGVRDIKKNGIDYYFLLFSDNPTLKYVCTDEEDIDEIKSRINSYGYTNCSVNTYCSFVPGGIYYTIQGKNKFDNDNNGCDVSDPIISNLYLKETNLNGDIIGSYISNSSGNYSIPVQAGTHTILPVLENPTYFNISPTIVNVTFPAQASPFVQDFCITANGLHPNLEITLLPLQPVRPGFDAKYKLVYKNKGNTNQSGTVNLTFNDSVLDMVAANPVAASQTTNNLSWNFINLLPLETREITFTMNVNSPMENPAVNIGDILNFTAIITSSATDETPTDNTFTLNQTVVGSYDPNDKTCLEGAVITPALIGQYVHYMIRFENTGTFAATNVVIKDMIDLSKFEISTLVPTSASHSYVTNISAGNKVEFIFENINLPFDDANNDGYIAFKIKTKPTLVVNDSFTNEANIYFDYNFPILTNKATSTFKTLGTPDFDFTRYFTVYPNPAKADLNITAKESINVKSISVYNTLGQLVLVVTNAEKTANIDVSSLKSGNYFIKIKTDKGSSNARFVKE